MKPVEYWEECLASAFDEHGVSATPEQIKAIAEDVKVSHENYGMAFYSPPAGEHLRRELDEANRKLRAEREKVRCRECNGRGRIITPGPYHSSDMGCWKCHGEGRHAP